MLAGLRKHTLSHGQVYLSKRCKECDSVWPQLHDQPTLGPNPVPTNTLLFHIFSLITILKHNIFVRGYPRTKGVKGIHTLEDKRGWPKPTSNEPTGLTNCWGQPAPKGADGSKPKPLSFFIDSIALGLEYSSHPSWFLIKGFSSDLSGVSDSISPGFGVFAFGDFKKDSVAWAVLRSTAKSFTFSRLNGNRH